jgi:hypothetical protein
LVKVSDLNVIGGGHFRLNYGGNTLTLFNDSQVYGRFSDFELARKISLCAHDWHTLNVIILPQ